MIASLIDKIGRQIDALFTVMHLFVIADLNIAFTTKSILMRGLKPDTVPCLRAIVEKFSSCSWRTPFSPCSFPIPYGYSHVAGAFSSYNSSTVYPYTEQDDAYMNFLIPAFFASYARKDGSAPLYMKFATGLYSAIGSFERPARNMKISYPSKSFAVQSIRSLCITLTSFGRLLPNQRRSMTSTS